MFGVGMQEIIVILVVALLVIGPKRLPDLARALGRAIGEFRHAADDLKEDLDINGLRGERDRLVQQIKETGSSKKTPPPAEPQPVATPEATEEENKG